MACLLPIECLNNVFENLEDNKATLYSCLFVNRLWCKVSVRILWRSFPYSRVIGVTYFRQMKDALSILMQNFKDKNWLISKEILKMFMDQISSLKSLTCHSSYNNVHVPDNIPFTSFPGARDCLTDLSELNCGSSIHSEFFYGLSQIC